MPTGSTSRTWRKFLRFSTRGLIVVVLVMGAGLGWVVRSARLQREAVAAIRRAGGHVVDGYPRQGLMSCGLEPEPRHPGPRVPRRLEEAIGTDYFFHPFEVSFKGTGSDNDLSHVAQLESLERLWIERSNVSDAGLAHLQGLNGLTYLSLVNNNVSDAGLVHLNGLSQLEDLDVQWTRVTAAGVRALQQVLPKLRVSNYDPS